MGNRRRDPVADRGDRHGSGAGGQVVGARPRRSRARVLARGTGCVRRDERVRDPAQRGDPLVCVDRFLRLAPGDRLLGRRRLGRGRPARGSARRRRRSRERAARWPHRLPPPVLVLPAARGGGADRCARVGWVRAADGAPRRCPAPSRVELGNERERVRRPDRPATARLARRPNRVRPRRGAETRGGLPPPRGGIRPVRRSARSVAGIREPLSAAADRNAGSTTSSSATSTSREDPSGGSR